MRTKNKTGWKEVALSFNPTILCPTVRDVRELAKAYLKAVPPGDRPTELDDQSRILANLMLPDVVLDRPIVDFALLRQEERKENPMTLTDEQVTRILASLRGTEKILKSIPFQASTKTRAHNTELCLEYLMSIRKELSGEGS